LEKPELYAAIERARRTPNDATSPQYGGNYQIQEIAKARAQKNTAFKNNDLDFIERGPGNVAGRTRAILVMPQDDTNETWLAGSASGGIWKTTDAGFTWENKTNDLPNLGTNTLAMSAANPEVIYAGTGEHFTSDIDGAGLFKSEDAGETWNQIVDPSIITDFRNVSRIIVDPNDENIALATTRNSVWGDTLISAIYKTIDGGDNWNKVYGEEFERYDDLDFNPLNFNKQYAAVNGRGVVVSTDGGDTWTPSNDGLVVSGRIEIAPSPVDTNRIWASVQGQESGTGSDLYISFDGGASWRLTIEGEGEEIPFLGSQGWYDNIITAHPFDANIAYVGGINIWRMKVSAEEIARIGFDIGTEEVESFLGLVNGAQIGGGVLKGEGKEDEELISVELRFGQGSQMAHRFSVGGRGSGVPANGYLYQDIVEVPFQAWDVEANRQLMLSFRDQADNGQFDLIERSLNNQPSDSREYIFIHDIDYADTANANIAMQGGHEFEQLYFLWPELQSGVDFDAAIEDPSALKITKRQLIGQSKETLGISDAYQEYDGRNTFTNVEFAANTGVHPDQHGIVTIITNPAAKQFQLLSTNDGGVYISQPSFNPGSRNGSFRYAGFGYNTTQFYGADKAPGEDRYIGGMQDNSTWFTPAGETSDDASSKYTFAVGGDGFEAIWNNRDGNLIIGSIQFNNFQRSVDNGVTWSGATNGITDNGPFTSRLSNSRALPDRLFTVGGSGVWKSDDFGSNWTSTPIDDMWSFNNNADIEVSHADPDYIWAGGNLSEDQRLFVSTDGGDSFTPTQYFQNIELGFCSGIGTHPFNTQKAFALFSFADKPKVLMTDDLGQTWTDISGFAESTDGNSTKGFPDVAVNSLLVFPNDTMRIWVGTEIGIVESQDGGATWGMLDSNFPNANAYDFKIQDDQIIVATYGRGIWSVEVEGIEREYIFAPTVDNTSINLQGDLNVETKYFNDFDSVQVLIGEGSYLTTEEVITGNDAYDISDIDLPEGEYDLVVRGFREGVIYDSEIRSVYIYKPRTPVRRYFNDFSTEEGVNDLFGNGFSVRLEEGFNDEALHSVHPYENLTELIYQLKTPWLVRDSQFMTYRDVAFIEVGEVGSQFGDADFYDYVVIEGSKDGRTWTSVDRAGYDSRSITRWRNGADSGINGDASFYIPHELRMTRNFEIGDTILIRFRLFADPGATAWGWVIDDLELRLDKTTPVVEVAGESFNIFPNPVSDVLNIDIPRDAKSLDIQMTSVDGRIVYQKKTNALKNVSGNTLNIDVSDLSSGIYFLSIRQDQEVGITRIFVE